MALVGVTFPRQPVSTKPTGAMQAAALPDGALRGCSLTFSGRQIILAAGELMIGGRLVSNDAALSSGSISATSGVARWVLKIDATQASTESEFAQLSTRVDVAASAAALPALVQQDINGSGTVYELELALANMGSSGVASLASVLPSARRVIRMGPGVPTAEDIAPGEIWLQI